MRLSSNSSTVHRAVACLSSESTSQSPTPRFTTTAGVSAACLLVVYPHVSPLAGGCGSGWASQTADFARSINPVCPKLCGLPALWHQTVSCRSMFLDNSVVDGGTSTAAARRQLHLRHEPRRSTAASAAQVPHRSDHLKAHVFRQLGRQRAASSRTGARSFDASSRVLNLTLEAGASGFPTTRLRQLWTNGARTARTRTQLHLRPVRERRRGIALTVRHQDTSLVQLRQRRGCTRLQRAPRVSRQQRRAPPLTPPPRPSSPPPARPASSSSPTSRASSATRSLSSTAPTSRRRTRSSRPRA